MKNNRGELSAGAPGFVIYGIKPGPRPGIDVYLTLLFLPSQTDAIHHVRHLTVQSVLETLDLGYSTRWNLWGLERRLAANSEFSAEGELTVYIITYHTYIYSVPCLYCSQSVDCDRSHYSFSRPITWICCFDYLMASTIGFLLDMHWKWIRYGIGSIQPVRLMAKFPKIHFGIRRLMRKHFVLSNVLWRTSYLSQIRLNSATGSSVSHSLPLSAG